MHWVHKWRYIIPVQTSAMTFSGEEIFLVRFLALVKTFKCLPRLRLSSALSTILGHVRIQQMGPSNFICFYRVESPMGGVHRAGHAPAHQKLTAEIRPGKTQESSVAKCIAWQPYGKYECVVYYFIHICGFISYACRSYIVYLVLNLYVLYRLVYFIYHIYIFSYFFKYLFLFFLRKLSQYEWLRDGTASNATRTLGTCGRLWLSRWYNTQGVCHGVRAYQMNFTFLCLESRLWIRK